MKKKKSSDKNLTLANLNRAFKTQNQYLTSMMGTKISEALFEQDMRFDEKLTQLRSDFYTKVDPFLKEIEDARIDRTLSTNNDEVFKSTLAAHNKRLTKLEKN